MQGVCIKVCVSGWEGKYAVDDSALGLYISTCAVDEMTRRWGKGQNPLYQVMKYTKFHS